MQRGLYRHYKGNLYEILHTAKHSETEETMIVYRALYGSYGVWVRPQSLFNDSVSKDGSEIPRFELVQAFDVAC
ncbi:DUF1653 domain-containing protein [Microbulbifer sp. A4B17]|uniref:DUF1653 domain-containing protein n=1 Tax=Microbulbifer sp. A4B17 TaxID=359370 RepID=UPI000D52EB9E|nr:DUF1653 domain-containing protein [Microbulbifer sp. A4B17]AWF80632.1 DUF1653 domain-containing protein [Microbulbifer sp. A4B17]